MAIKFLENLSKNYLEILSDEDFDVIIKTKESLLQAHSIILRNRSSYFRNALTKSDNDKDNIKRIDLSHVPTQQFKIIIKYIYGGVILLENYDTQFIFEFLIIACEFLLEDLVKYLEFHLIEAKANWLRLHFAHVYTKCLQDNKLQRLYKWCNDIIAKYPNWIFRSEGFISLPENTLISLLERDDLSMEEGKIWDHVIKWGIAKNSNLPPDLKDWSYENFLSLKITLQNCLPLIRYFQISNEDIIDNVKPYKKILKKQLWDDIFKKFLAPDRTILTKILPARLPFSVVINKLQAAEIASWIDKKTIAYTDDNNPYEFNLLLRGSRDGFTYESFWKLCNKQANLVVILKVKNTEEILGGYNPIGWDKSVNNWINCKETFIFSLKNGTIKNSILSRVKDSKYAIRSYSDYGAQFGREDLFIGNYFACYHSSYEKALRHTDGPFLVSEYEIFQIHKF